MQSPMKNPFFKLSQKWFNDPTFVDFFEYGDRIFLVFQEKLDESSLVGEKRKPVSTDKILILKISHDSSIKMT